MNLNIIYLPNKTGKKLLDNIEEEWGSVEHNEINIQGKKYLNIALSDIKSRARKILNTPRTIRNCLDKEKISGILGVNRILFGNVNTEGVSKVYKVLICDMACISIQVKSRVKSKEKNKYIKESDNSRVVETARRVVYLLGLDFGMVYLVLTGKRRLKVIYVDPSPEIRDRDLNRLLKKIQKIYQIDDYLNNHEVKLGADPEFMMVNSKNGKMLSASQFFPREGTVGCDSIRIPNRQQRPVAELRPKPEKSPIDLMENIRTALYIANRMAPYRNVRWLAGSQPIAGYSIGGHIHFSNTQLNFSILRALDNYIGIPIFLIENPLTAIKRRKKYGFLCDYRTKDYGGFEYRTPGSWLISQQIATAILCLAKIVASNYHYLPQNYLVNVEAQKAFYEGRQNFFQDIFIRLWANLEKLEMYKEYAKELKIIKEMVSEGNSWDEKVDFRKSWQMIYQKNNKKKIPQKPVRESDNSSRGNSTTSVNSSTRTATRVRPSRNTNRITNANLTGNRSRSRSAVSASIDLSNRSSLPSNNISNTNRNRSRSNPPRGRIIDSSQIGRRHTIR